VVWPLPVSPCSYARHLRRSFRKGRARPQADPQGANLDDRWWAKLEYRNHSYSNFFLILFQHGSQEAHEFVDFGRVFLTSEVAAEAANEVYVVRERPPLRKGYFYTERWGQAICKIM
jgi:hypothetical protein